MPEETKTLVAATSGERNIWLQVGPAIEEKYFTTSVVDPVNFC